MENRERYSYEDFLEIIRTLRSENGCPWDREQTHMSLRPCLMEEAAEVLAGIRIYEQTGNFENLREELGDVLLQVVMHAQIAREEGLFGMEDVVDEVAKKMIRRHPHVFGDRYVENSAQVLQNWEEIKKSEKAEKKSGESPLREIPLELPALTRAVKVLKKGDKLYRTGRSYEEAVSALEAAVQDLKQYSPTEHDDRITEQIGSALMAVSDVARICKVAPEQVLTDKIEDIIEDYEQKNRKYEQKTLTNP